MTKKESLSITNMNKMQTTVFCLCLALILILFLTIYRVTPLAKELVVATSAPLDVFSLFLFYET